MGEGYPLIGQADRRRHRHRASECAGGLPWSSIAPCTEGWLCLPSAVGASSDCSGCSCAIVVAAAVAGLAEVDVTVGASAKPVVACMDVFDVLIEATERLLGSASDAGAPCTWKPDPPRPWTPPQKSVILHRAEGL